MVESRDEAIGEYKKEGGIVNDDAGWVGAVEGRIHSKVDITNQLQFDEV